MSITDTIRADWDSLSERAQDHIRNTRPHLVNEWRLSDEGGYYDTITADTMDEALEIAEDTCCGRDAFPDSSGTIYLTLRATNTVTGETGTVDVQLDEEAPECDDDQEHDWRSPYSVLGGLKENPGVWGRGGGVIIKEVCAHCGRYKITDTWAQRRDTGEQGLTEVSYEDADEYSYAWITRALMEDLERVTLPDGYTFSDDGDGKHDPRPRLTREADAKKIILTDEEMRAVIAAEDWADIIEDQLPPLSEEEA